MNHIPKKYCCFCGPGEHSSNACPWRQYWEIRKDF